MRKALTHTFIALALLISALALPLAVRPATRRGDRHPDTRRAPRRRAHQPERAERGLAKLSLPHLAHPRGTRAHPRDGRPLGPHARQRERLDACPRACATSATSATACTYWTIGESIACGKAGTSYAQPAAIVALWMQSPSHRAVLLTARLRDIGVGIVVGDDGMRYFTVDLGRRIIQ